jgi:hypothetical protein
MRMSMIAIGVGMHDVRRHTRQKHTQCQKAQQGAQADRATSDTVTEPGNEGLHLFSMTDATIRRNLPQVPRQAGSAESSCRLRVLQLSWLIPPGLKAAFAQCAYSHWADHPLPTELTSTGSEAAHLRQPFDHRVNSLPQVGSRLPSEPGRRLERERGSGQQVEPSGRLRARCRVDVSAMNMITLDVRLGSWGARV